MEPQAQGFPEAEVATPSGHPVPTQVPPGPRAPAGRLQGHWSAQMMHRPSRSQKGEPNSKHTRTSEAARLYTSALAALHPASHSAPPQAFHSARGRPYFPAGRWAPSCGVASGRPCRSCLWAAREWRAARRRPLDRPGFVLRGGVLVAGPRETSHLDATGPSRRRLGLAPLGPGADFRFLPSAAALFPAATHGLRAALCLRPSGAGGTGPRPRRVFAFGLCPTFSFGFELPAIVGAGF